MSGNATVSRRYHGSYSIELDSKVQLPGMPPRLPVECVPDSDSTSQSADRFLFGEVALYRIRMLMIAIVRDVINSSVSVVNFFVEKIMPKYLLIYRDSTEPRPQPSPEEMQGFLKMWDDWFNQCGKKIVDKGDGLLPTGRTLQPGGVVADGPYVEAKEMIGGFSVVEANSYDEAVEISKKCPIAIMGGPIEIREFAGFV